MKRSTSTPSRTDSRLDSRLRTQFKGWLDFNGDQRSVRGIDLTESGALVTSSVPMAPDSAVFLCITSHGLMGWAKVKHCSRYGFFRYRIGLAFRGALMRAQEGNWQFA